MRLVRCSVSLIELDGCDGKRAGKIADLNVTTMNNVTINSFIPINDLSVDTWTGTAGISATSLNNIKIKHSFGGSINATRVIKFQAGTLVAGCWSSGGGSSA